jgi:hypothetical protein
LPTPSLTGAGITWDYSALVPASQTIDTFLSVASTPIAYQLFFNDAILYPNYKATVAQSGASIPSNMYVTVTNVINYYLDEASNYESVGFGAGINSIPTSIKDDTIDVVYKFPMNYLNADSCHSSSTTNIPGLGYYLQTQYRVNQVEGWGTLKTPFGTFPTLKVKTLIYTTDSIYVSAFGFGFKLPQPEQIQYKWLTNGEHVPVLQINETAGAKGRRYLYRDSTRNGLLGLGVADMKSSLNSVSLYPNPTSENATVSYSLAGTSQVNIAVYSVDGRCISNVYVGQQSLGNHTVAINVLNLQAGIYLLKLEANGEQTVKKLVVEK